MIPISRRNFLGSLAALPATSLFARAVDPDVTKSETDRIAVINKVRPSVVCVCSYGGGVVGSGVLISADGYALTNYHVTDSISPVMQGGLADGLLYDAVIVGQDTIGDVALIKLLPRKEGTPFPFAVLADSDLVRSGDWSLAMGNPFGLSQDFTPTVTYGLVSGVNRYQPPEGGGKLEYTDCIQIETSINPGNSGGPLFNMKGELIGINGRGSFDKRGRVNSGVGYAISINQIKNFLGQFKAGIDTDHATLGASVNSKNEDGALSLMTIGQVLEESDAFRRGIKPGDEIVSFAGRPLTSTNQYKNILGIFPAGWRLPLVYRRDNQRKEVLIRLMGNADAPVDPNAEAKPPAPKPKGPADPNAARAKKSPAMKLFKEKKGYANWHFNNQVRDEIWKGFASLGDFAKFKGTWIMTGAYEANERKGDFLLTIGDVNKEPEAKLKLNVDYALKPLALNNQVGERLVPDGSGGLLSGLYQYRHLLMEGLAGFEFSAAAGTEPVYPPGPDGLYPEEIMKSRVMCDVIKTRHAAVEVRWYFEPASKKLIAAEVFAVENEDPCEIYFSDYKPLDGRQLPHRLEVRHGDKRYGYFTFKDYRLS